MAEEVKVQGKRRLIHWAWESATSWILNISKKLEDPKAEAQIEASFDIKALRDKIIANPDSEFTRDAIGYLAKQRLMDTGAGAIGDADGKITAAKKRFDELLEGKWTGERVNATGAAENKKIAAGVKEALAGPVSLESLALKKLLKPSEFTKEDQAKLTELIQAAATITARNGKK